MSIAKSTSSAFEDSFYTSINQCINADDDYDGILPASAKNTVGVLERVVCKYGDREDDYCRVLFKYRQRGLDRRFLLEFKPHEGRTEGAGWYEHPIRGQVLKGPPLCEVFPGREGGDLFLNWVEYPVRCQVWRYRKVSWVPFQEAAWEPLPWGFQDEITKGILVIIPGEHIPAFVTGLTFEASYRDIHPIIIDP